MHPELGSDTIGVCIYSFLTFCSSLVQRMLQVTLTIYLKLFITTSYNSS
jgi:hypothetical protein